MRYVLMPVLAFAANVAPHQEAGAQSCRPADEQSAFMIDSIRALVASSDPAIRKSNIAMEVRGGALVVHEFMTLDGVIDEPS